MFRLNFARAHPIECFILVEPRPDGPVVGYYADHAIAAAVVDYFGCRFTYVGVAPRLRSGRYDTDSLLPGEWIVEPGLVYYSNPSKSGGLLGRLLGSGRHSTVGTGGRI